MCASRPPPFCAIFLLCVKKKRKGKGKSAFVSLCSALAHSSFHPALEAGRRHHGRSLLLGSLELVVQELSNSNNNDSAQQQSVIIVAREAATIVE
jgi:hypothetical protein